MSTSLLCQSDVGFGQSVSRSEKTRGQWVTILSRNSALGACNYQGTLIWFFFQSACNCCILRNTQRKQIQQKRCTLGAGQRRRQVEIGGGAWQGLSGFLGRLEHSSSVRGYVSGAFLRERHAFTNTN